jgi:putative peptidoglycan lipid II flippase
MQATVRRLLFGGLLGKGLGIARELLAAAIFGTGLVAGAYRMAQAAFLIPLHGFASDVVSGAFTPEFSRLRHSDPLAAGELFAALNAAMAVVSVVVAALMICLAEQIVGILAPGFTTAARDLTKGMLQVLSLAMPAYILVALYGAVDLVVDKGSLMSLRASIQSIGLIFGALGAWLLGKPLLLPAGFVLSYVVLLVWGAAICHRLGLPFSIHRSRRKHYIIALGVIWRVFRILIWVPIVLQIVQTVERRVASTIGIGAVAALDYARFISETVLVLVALPFGAVGQARMSNMGGDEYRREAINSLSIILAVGWPCAAFLIIHAGELVSILLQRGAFDAQSADVTSTILSAQAIGLPAALVAYAGQKFMNARGLNGLVLRGVVVGSILAVAINLLLVSRLGVMVLGFSVAASSLVVASFAISALGIWRDLRVVLVGGAAVLLVHWSVIHEVNLNFNVSIFGQLAVGILIWVGPFLISKTARGWIAALFQRLLGSG